MPDQPSNIALLVIDMQWDFIHGTLKVPGAFEIIPGINRSTERYRHVIFTQDWHPRDHSSFRENSERGPWPSHCVQGSSGAGIYGVGTNQARAIIRKGMDSRFDSYSGFQDEGEQSTGLEGLLRSLGVDHVHLCGLARDYCVAATERDARSLGFDTTILEPLCRSVNASAT